MDNKRTKEIEIMHSPKIETGSPSSRLEEGRTSKIPRLFNRWFVPYATGQALFALANSIFMVLLTITVYRLTKTGTSLAGLMFVRNLPLVVFGPFAGVFVDRFSKRAILVYCNLVFALTCLALGIIDALWQVFTLVFLYMTAWTLYKPTRYATIPVLVREDLVLQANSALMMIDEAVAMVGSSLGGLLSAFGGHHPYWVNAALMFTVAIILWFGLYGHRKLDGLCTTLSRDTQFHLVKDLCIGWKYMVKHQQLLPLSFIVALIWLSLGTFLSVQIIYITRALSLPDYYYGYASSLGSLGSILGFLISPILVHKFRLNKWILFPLGYALAGVFTLTMAGSHNVWISMAALLLVCMGSGASNAVEETLEQEIPAEEYRGKVISFISTIGTLGYLIGITIAPISSDLIGVRIVFLFSAILLFLTSLVITRYLGIGVIKKGEVK